MAEIENSIAQCCKQLRLSTNFAGQALTLEGDTPQKYLLNLLENEISYRIEKRKSKYLNTAGFPRRYRAEEFKTDEIDFPDGISFQSLLDLDFYHAGKNVIMYGGTGTGKTMLSILIGMSACNQEIPVRFYRTAGLINLFSESQGKGTLSTLKKKLNSAQILILDEFGYVPYDRSGSQLLFDYLSEIHEQKSVRLDIYANDSEGKQYNIEVQQDDSGAVPERARLNSSLFDTRLTTSGSKYTEMPETYIIFITSNDVLDGGLPIYTIERTVQETGKLFNDKAHIVYVNGSYRGNDEVGWLMHDFNCVNYHEMHNAKIAARVRYFKEEPKGVADMCKTMQVIVDRERDDAEVTRSKKIAWNMWKNGEHDLDKIAETTLLSAEQVREAITQK